MAVTAADLSNIRHTSARQYISKQKDTTGMRANYGMRIDNTKERSPPDGARGPDFSKKPVLTAAFRGSAASEWFTRITSGPVPDRKPRSYPRLSEVSSVSSSPKPVLVTGMQELLRPNRFSTAILEKDRQFSFWRDLLFPLMDVAPVAPGGEGFRASGRSFDLGVAQVVALKSEAMRFTRSGAHSDASANYWCLTILKRGTLLNRVGDNIVEVTPGTILINSLADTFSGKSSRLECINLLLNRDFFFDMEANIDALVNTRLQGPAARILSEFVLNSEKLFPALTVAETSLWIETFSLLLGAVTRQARENPHQASTAGSRDRASVVLNYIRDNLHSPTLGATSICQALRMSRRQLYYLLAPYGGVAKLITRKRLIAACKALASTGESRLISTVAYSLGFSNHAVFCKQFREEFGFSPSDARDASICGYLPRKSPPNSLFDWLTDGAAHRQ